MKRYQTLFGTGWIDSQKVILAKPLIFMNRSGEAVKKTLHFSQVEVRDLIIIHDDLDLPFGRLRFKKRGGDGGHQGVRSIIEMVGENNFLRLKVGIGRPPKGMDPAEFVLTSFNVSEKNDLEGILTRASEALGVALSEGLDTAMNRYQKK